MLGALALYDHRYPGLTINVIIPTVTPKFKLPVAVVSTEFSEPT